MLNMPNQTWQSFPNQREWKPLRQFLKAELKRDESQRWPSVLTHWPQTDTVGPSCQCQQHTSPVPWKVLQALGWRNLIHEGHEGHPDIHNRSSWDGHCGNSSLGNANPGLLTTDEPQNQRAIKALLWARNTSFMSWLSLSKHTPRPPSDHLHSLPIKQALFWAPFCQTMLSMFYVNCSCHIYKWQKSLLCYRIKF